MWDGNPQGDPGLGVQSGAHKRQKMEAWSRSGGSNRGSTSRLGPKIHNNQTYVKRSGTWDIKSHITVVRTGKVKNENIAVGSISSILTFREPMYRDQNTTN